MLVPFILERTAYGERGYDIFSALLSQRICFLDDHVDPAPASIMVAQLLFLESQAPDKDIFMYINSPGGSVIDGMSIIDTMRHIKCDVSTIVTGSAASMGAVILSSGTPGKRFALPHAEIMTHQVKASMSKRQATDIEIHAERIKEMNRTLTEILAKNCGKTYEEMLKYMDRDSFFNAESAKKFGIIDHVL